MISVHTAWGFSRYRVLEDIRPTTATSDCGGCSVTVNGMKSGEWYEKVTSMAFGNSATRKFNSVQRLSRSEDLKKMSDFLGPVSKSLWVHARLNSIANCRPTYSQDCSPSTGVVQKKMEQMLSVFLSLNVSAGTVNSVLLYLCILINLSVQVPYLVPK